MTAPRRRRVLLKLSGESLSGAGEHGYSASALAAVAGEIRAAVDAGVELAIVVGGGNVFRGAELRGTPVGRDSADRMGMLATLMNGLALRESCRGAGLAAEILTGLSAPEVGDTFTRERAVAALTRGAVLILAGGTGHPYFTTDTAAALRTLEIGADALLKATKVDGIYSADPAKDASATRYETVSYDECLRKSLGVMDQAAFALCRDEHLEIVVFDMSPPGRIRAAALGERVGTRVVR
ncbi:MAG: UMP kinase [Planctomycetes bacterium]|nr:UMP kinase [Planctomycetota bacterium]